MFKLMLDPKKYAAKNLLRYTDLCSSDHYDLNQKVIMERIKVAATRNAYAHMTKFECDVYVFSEQELIDLVKEVRGK